jgi:hypothetical protein
MLISTELVAGTVGYFAATVGPAIKKATKQRPTPILVQVKILKI